MQQASIRILVGVIVLVVMGVAAVPGSAAISLVPPQGSQSNPVYAASNAGSAEKGAPAPFENARDRGG